MGYKSITKIQISILCFGRNKKLFFEKIKVKIVKKMDKIKNLLKISLNSSNLKPLKRFKFTFFI